MNPAVREMLTGEVTQFDVELERFIRDFQRLQRGELVGAENVARIVAKIVQAGKVLRDAVVGATEAQQEAKRALWSDEDGHVAGERPS